MRIPTRILVYLYALVFLCDFASANSFFVGAGGDFEQLRFSESSYQSVYQGPGGLLEARLRIWPDIKTGFGLDFSGFFSQRYLSNVSFSEEKATSVLYGGALDLTLHWLFAGVTHSRRRLSLTKKSGARTSLSFATYGARAGVIIRATDKIAVSAKVVYEFGSIVQPTASSIHVLDVQSISGSLLVHFSFAGGS